MVQAWNSGVILPENPKKKFDLILDKATQGPVYLISDANELHIEHILQQLKQYYPALDLTNINIRLDGTKAPIQLFNNVYLCITYQYQNNTDELVEHLVNESTTPATLLSQSPLDLKKAKELNLNVISIENFFVKEQLAQYISKRKQGEEYYTFRYLLSFFNCDSRAHGATAKLSAADKLLTYWDNPDALMDNLTDFEMHALCEGQLGQIAMKHPSLSTTLKQKKRSMIHTPPEPMEGDSLETLCKKAIDYANYYVRVSPHKTMIQHHLQKGLDVSGEEQEKETMLHLGFRYPLGLLQFYRARLQFFAPFKQKISLIKNARVGNCGELSDLVMDFFYKAYKKGSTHIELNTIYVAKLGNKTPNYTVSGDSAVDKRAPDHMMVVVGNYIVDPFCSLFCSIDQYKNDTLALESSSGDSMTVGKYSSDEHDIEKLYALAEILDSAQEGVNRITLS